MPDSKYPTIGGVVTQGECLTKLNHNLREAQEMCYMLGHLTKSMSISRKDQSLGDGYLAVGHFLDLMIKNVGEIARGKIQ